MSSVKIHPVDQTELLLYAEGELATGVCNRVRSHITGCPDCQAELKNLQSGINTLIQFRSDFALLVPAPAPPGRWEPLDVRIEAWERRWKVGSLLEGWRAILRPGYGLAAMAVVLALTVICFILQPWHETVSANELLARATVAQSKSLSGAQGRVIHERLQIRRKSGAHGQDAANNDKDKTINYESWQDDSHHRFHETSSSAEITGELQRVYQTNNLDWQSPLSATAYARWQTSLVEKHDSVARSGSADLTLTTVASGQPEGDAIGKAQLVVSATDWLPIAVHLWLRDREYEISQVSSELLPASQLDSSLFGTSAPALLRAAAAAATLSPSSLPSSLRPASPKSVEQISAPVIASALTPAFVPEQAVAANSKASTDVAAPATLQNTPDAPSHTLPAARAVASAPAWPSAMAASGSPVPRTHASTGITLTFEPDDTEQLLPGLQPQGTTVAPMLVPDLAKPRPFKAFTSSTVIITNPQPPPPMHLCPLKALGTKLGILKQRKTKPVASSKPGG